MVQVDIIWSYAFGASYAAASVRTLAKCDAPLNNKIFNRLMIFLAVLFAPSGIYLLSAFPRWETMQVATDIRDLPPWLMTLFAVTNITQGMLGYYVGYRMARAGNYYGAHVNSTAAWILFWFVLVCGWDCLGWQRFLYDSTTNSDIPWAPGKHMGFGFIKSNVSLTLVSMGVFFAPALYYGLVEANYDDLSKDPSVPIGDRPSLLKIGARSLGFMFSVYLGLAIVAAFIVMAFNALTGVLWAGYLIGLPLAIVGGWALLFRRGRLMQRLLQTLYIKE